MTGHLVVAWRLREDAELKQGADDRISLTLGNAPAVDFRVSAPQVRHALLGLREGLPDGSLPGPAPADHHAVALLTHHLELLRQHLMLVAELWLGRRRVVTLIPRSRDFRLASSNPAPGAWLLSRFAYLHRDGEHLVLDSPDARCAARLHGNQVVAWLQEARRPTTRHAGTPRAQLLAMLGGQGFLVRPDDREGEAQRTWEFHDRLFHDRTRNHDAGQLNGRGHRFAGRFPSPPALRPHHPGEITLLSRPRPPASRSLLDVMEERRSRQDMGRRNVSLGQVSELLYRVARVHGTLASPGQDCLLRPYPAAGAIHELEYYLAVDRCDGLDRGLYHYRAAEHALTRLAAGSAPAREMLDSAAAAWSQPGHRPQCLLVLASRVPRLAWKYQAIAYKLALLNAGVVLQSLHLVCTDLALNASAIVMGRPELLGAATGTSSWEEACVAEFGFGSRPGHDP